MMYGSFDYQKSGFEALNHTHYDVATGIACVTSNLLFTEMPLVFTIGTFYTDLLLLRHCLRGLQKSTQNIMQSEACTFVLTHAKSV